MKTEQQSLWQAAEQGNLALVEQLLQQHVEVNFVWSRQLEWSTPLLVAVGREHYSIVDRLLQAGANIEAVGKTGLTALMQASRHGTLEMVQFLCQRGANLQTADFNGYTALHHAVQAEQAEVVQFLLQQGSRVNQLTQQGFSELAIALQTGNLQIIEQLLRAGSAVNQAGEHGTTPLMIAAQMGKTELVQLLVQYGADLQAVDREGKTALQIAQQSGQSNVVALLSSLMGGAAGSFCKPVGSKVRLIKRSSAFEVVIPSIGTTPEQLFIIMATIVVISTAFVGFLWLLKLLLALGGSSYDRRRTSPLFNMTVGTSVLLLLLLLVICGGAMYYGAQLLFHVLFDTFGVLRLRVDAHTISMTAELFGHRWTHRETVSRAYVQSLLLTTKRYLGGIQDQPQLLILISGQDYEIGGKGHLSLAELQWIGSELGQFMGLPFNP